MCKMLALTDAYLNRRTFQKNRTQTQCDAETVEECTCSWRSNACMYRWPRSIGNRDRTSSTSRAFAWCQKCRTAWWRWRSAKVRPPARVVPRIVTGMSPETEWATRWEPAKRKTQNYTEIRSDRFERHATEKRPAALPNSCCTRIESKKCKSTTPPGQRWTTFWWRWTSFWSQTKSRLTAAQAVWIR